MTARARGSRKPRNTAVDPQHLLSTIHHPAGVAARKEARFTPPVATLNRWVERIQQHPGLPPGAAATIPWFDPRGGGDQAKVLFLMQDPSKVATGTGFISPDNDDITARNGTVACDTAGLRRQDRVHWNIFPWWVNVRQKGEPVDSSRPPQSHSEAMPLAKELLGELLLTQLPALQVVVLLGGQAQSGWDRYLKQGGRVPAGLLTEPLRCPSCSGMAWNTRNKQTGIKNSQLTIDALAEAARLVRA